LLLVINYKLLVKIKVELIINLYKYFMDTQVQQATVVTPTKMVPTGVKIIAVLYYIGTVLEAIAGIGMLAGGGFMGAALSRNFGGVGIVGGAFFIVAGIILLGFAVLSFFIGRGLWHGKNWARILAIIFGCLGVLSGLGSIAKGSGGSYVSLIINLVIVLYLWLTKEVKMAFA
jgi:hypothetical protein